MEWILLALVAGALAVGLFASRRWLAGSPSEPWLLVAGAVVLLLMAWTWGGPEMRGPTAILTGGALLTMIRAARIWRERDEEDEATPGQEGRSM